MKRVILASSYDHSYDFFGPLTSRIWKEYVGFQPTALLVEDEAGWQNNAHSRVVLGKYKEIGADVFWIGKIDGYEIAQQAQASRQHACALDLPLDDYIMTADIDLWPLTKGWFHQQDSAKDIQLFYANAYKYKYFCTSFVGANVSVWRDIMKIDGTKPLNEELQKSFDKYLTRDHDSGTAWNFDETYFGSRIKAWSGYPSKCQFIEREGAPPRDRIDRSGWKDISITGMVDAHLLRPGAVPPNWEFLLRLFEQLLPQHKQWAHEYCLAYREARYGMEG